MESFFMAVYYSTVLYNQIFFPFIRTEILSIYTDCPYAYAILHTWDFLERGMLIADN